MVHLLEACVEDSILQEPVDKILLSLLIQRDLDDNDESRDVVGQVRVGFCGADLHTVGGRGELQIAYEDVEETGNSNYDGGVGRQGAQTAQRSVWSVAE